MVSTFTTRQSHTEITSEISHETKPIWVCPNPWGIQLQHHSTSPAWNTRNYSWKTNCERNLAPHGVKWCYIGPSMEHYRFHHVYVTKKKRREWLIMCWIFLTQHSTPLQLFPRKFHYRGAQIGPFPAEPSTPSSILQHCWLPNCGNWETLRYIFQGCR